MRELIYGDRVRTSRVLRSLRTHELAKAADWSTATQSRVEQSPALEISFAELWSVAQRTNFPEDYFRTPPPPSLAPDELLFRAPVRTTKREKLYLTEFARVTGEVLSWLDSSHRLPPVRLPVLPADTDITTAAAQLRHALGLDEQQPIGHLTHLLERIGVTVVLRDIPDEKALRSTGAPLTDSADAAILFNVLREDHLGYSIRLGELRDRPLIVHRAQKSWEKTRLTIAHEAAHLVLHSRTLPLTAEYDAYDFAAELLAPSAILAEELPRPVTLRGLVPIKMRYGISLGALIKHLNRHLLISSDRHDMLTSQLYKRRNATTGTTWGRLEPGWDERSIERPGLLRAWTIRSLASAIPNAVATMSRIWPSDFIAALLSGQRTDDTTLNSPTPVRRSSPSMCALEPSDTTESHVVDLSKYRAREA